MRKVYLEGPLGQKFGEEWELAVSTPSEALTAIMAQRPGMRQFLTASEGIQGYEVLIDNEPIDMLEELVINDASQTQSYTFVPVIGGSKSSALMMVLGVTLVAMTGGLGAGFVPGFMGASTAGAATAGTVATAAQAAAVTAAGGTLAAGSTIGIGAAATLAGTSSTAILATQGLGMLGMGLLLGGAAMMLAPDVPDGSAGEGAENYLFGGPVNTVKQGEPIPLVYGRAIVGSKTISASLFTNTSRQKLTAGRKMVGIPDFRTDGSKSGTNQNTTTYSWQDQINVRGL
jgi:predicted phage tail protein